MNIFRSFFDFLFIIDLFSLLPQIYLNFLEWFAEFQCCIELKVLIISSVIDLHTILAKVLRISEILKFSYIFSNEQRRLGEFEFHRIQWKKEGQVEETNDIPKALVNIDGRTEAARNRNKKVSRSTKSRKLWRSLITHNQDGHGS